MKPTDYKYYMAFPSNTVSLSSVPKTVRNSTHFQNLLDAKIIDLEKSGRGRKVTVIKPEAYAEFVAKHFPDTTNDTQTKAANIRKFRNSKARKIYTPPVFLARGFKLININGKRVDLKTATESFGLFAVKEPNLTTDNVCFVENLDTFLKAEKVLGKNHVFLHRYGRIGTDSIKNISAKKVVVFVDYDFNGLAEYLRVKSVFPNAILYMPDNFQVLFDEFSVTLNGRQKATKAIMDSPLSEVVMIRELVAKTNRFLEQEILTDD